MDLELRRGKLIPKHHLKTELHRIKLSEFGSLQAFALLKKTGYIDIKGKMVLIKKDITILKH